MKNVHLVHWNAEEAKDLAAILIKAGYEVKYNPPGPTVLREIREKNPDAIVIDLSRLPSQGRDMALNIRYAKSTRSIPIVFVGGNPDKVENVKKYIPDAAYTAWDSIKSSLKNAIANPPLNPVAPTSVFDAYSDSPLIKKLGIKPESVIAILGAPGNFMQLLKDMPKDVKIVPRFGPKCHLAIWFIKSKSQLDSKIKSYAANLRDKGGLWIAWPKKASSIKTDLNETIVRKPGLGNGLVDYKVCAIDSDWTGLKFSRRRDKKGGE